ncbi:MAG: leucine-rich repeat domain-containing protein [Clostridium sp.]|nr:leucine-rich repeat domain-containing protein [Prevotella sp.]MCM1428317.1 leucine-rich repeat domain-containing protein [Clostridium sp.]MCM1474789.1 leucine-rich repeat domain-containing protein [Muribaculaceae bacterium]
MKLSISRVILSVCGIIAGIACQGATPNDTVRIAENIYEISNWSATLIGVNRDNPDQVIPDKITYTKDNKELKVKVTCIKKGLFKNTNLSSIKLPEYLTSIQDSAFYNTKLTYVYFPKYVTEIGAYSFAECKDLRETEFDPDIAEYDTKLKYWTFGKYAFKNCSSLQHLVLPKKLEASFCMVNEPELRSVNGHEEYIYYTHYYPVWEGCTSLRSIDTGAGMKSFELPHDCPKLEVVILGKKVTEVSSYTDYEKAECPALTDIFCISPTPPGYFETDIFADNVYDRVTLHVPYYWLDEYRADKNWSKFKNIKEFVPSDVPDFTDINIVDENKEPFPYSIVDGTLRIDDNARDLVYVYSMDGRNVATLRPGARLRIGPGLYILVMGEEAFKIKI